MKASAGGPGWASVAIEGWVSRASASRLGARRSTCMRDWLQPSCSDEPNTCSGRQRALMAFRLCCVRSTAGSLRGSTVAMVRSACTINAVHRKRLRRVDWAGDCPSSVLGWTQDNKGSVSYRCRSCLSRCGKAGVGIGERLNVQAGSEQCAPLLVPDSHRALMRGGRRGDHPRTADGKLPRVRRVPRWPESASIR
jgi:hypothetical protein